MIGRGRSRTKKRIARLLESLVVSTIPCDRGLSQRLSHLRDRVLSTDGNDVPRWHALLLDIFQMYGGMGSLNDYTLLGDPEAGELYGVVRGTLETLGLVQPLHPRPVISIGPPNSVVPEADIASVRSTGAACPLVREIYLYAESVDGGRPALVVGMLLDGNRAAPAIGPAMDGIAAALRSSCPGIAFDLRILEDGSFALRSLRAGIGPLFRRNG